MPNVGDIVSYRASEYDVVNHGVDAETEYAAIVVSSSGEGESQSYSLRVLTPSGRDLVVDVAGTQESGTPGSIVENTQTAQTDPIPPTPDPVPGDTGDGTDDAGDGTDDTTTDATSAKTSATSAKTSAASAKAANK